MTKASTYTVGSECVARKGTASTSTARSTSIAIMSRRLSTLSTMTPANGPKTTQGSV